ncbi:DUF6193 family natural product biosynthesis protein [Streptomyces sp. NPDC088097]|uniref:DUF6193 family natural product biosynthesis protein n=1 Tax=Streptomyces sp. NPDC088097 TaxID=3365823 RepID=UPI003806D592
MGWLPDWGQGPLRALPALPDLPAARLRGPAAVVEAVWEGLVLAAHWQRDRHDLRRPGRPYPPLLALLEAARADPVLGRLRPYTSHCTLLFSACVDFPYDVRVSSVEPLSDGRFRVRPRGGATAEGYADTPEAALALITADLPAGLGPAAGAGPTGPKESAPGSRSASTAPPPPGSGTPSPSSGPAA